MKKISILFTLIIVAILSFSKTFATTWDEPWADNVIKKSEHFVLAEIINQDEHKGVKIKIIKQLGGNTLPTEIEITNFYDLDIMSSSAGHGPEFHFYDDLQCYFFIKKNAKGEYCIATPTSGFAYIKDGKVKANYRHSYHMSFVPVDVYELTMIAIFNHYHQLAFDKKIINKFIDSNLAKAPAGFEENEIDNFFLQHVSLELIYHLRLDGHYAQILPFLNDTTNFHNRISAARALIAYNRPETKKLLVNKISNNKNDDFVIVICIWTLKDFKPKELKSTLEKLLLEASEEDAGFGGNIMDPRIATYFPTVKSALDDLIKSL